MTSSESDSEFAELPKTDAGMVSGAIMDNGVAYDIAANPYSGSVDYNPSGRATSDSTNKEVVEALKEQVLSQKLALIESRREATKEAVLAARAHQRQLEAARQEAAQAKAEAEKIRQQAAEAADAMAREVFRAETRAARAISGRPIRPKEEDAERKQMAARIATLETEVAAAQAKKTFLPWREPKFWVQMGTVAIMVSAIVKFSISPTALPKMADRWQPQAEELSSPLEKAEADPPDDLFDPELAESVERSVREAGLKTASDIRFHASVRRLILASAAVPDRSFKELVEEVNRNRSTSGHSCPFEWNAAGELALVLDLQKSSASPLSAGVDSCAEGVEGLARDRKPQLTPLPNHP